MKFFCVLLVSTLLTFSGKLIAEIKPYQSIDNAGLNKQERIEVIDKYMVDLVSSLKNMENKLDENSKKIKSLEDSFKSMKAAEIKKAEVVLGEKKTPLPKDLSEMEKIKADILAMKNQDIEKLKINVDELSDTVKALQATMKTLIK